MLFLFQFIWVSGPQNCLKEILALWQIKIVPPSVQCRDKQPFLLTFKPVVNSQGTVNLITVLPPYLWPTPPWIEILLRTWSHVYFYLYNPCTSFCWELYVGQRRWQRRRRWFVSDVWLISQVSSGLCSCPACLLRHFRKRVGVWHGDAHFEASLTSADGNLTFIRLPVWFLSFFFCFAWVNLSHEEEKLSCQEPPW